MRDAIADFFEVTAGAAFNVPSQEAIDYFKAKGLSPTFHYADMLGEEHATAFTVAKMMDADMLLDVQKSLDEALSGGVLFREWADQLVPMLQAKGWWGRKEVIDPLTGNVVVAQLGSPWRLETIFRTNMQASYSAGHWQQIMDQADIAPYLMYDAVDDFRTRAAHKSWDGKVLPITDKFWRTHYPPNGFNCRCSVIQLSDDDLEELGLEVDKSPRISYGPWVNPRTGQTLQIPEGIDPGFNYNPGKARYEHNRKLQAEKIAAIEAEDMRKAALAGAMAAEEAAKAEITKALTEKTPWLAKAVEKIQATKAGKDLNAQELLAKAKEAAAKAEQSSNLSKYKQAVLAGKDPSDKAKAAFDALPDEAQASLTADLQAQIAAAKAEAEAQAKLAELLASTPGSYTGKAVAELQKAGALDGMTADKVAKIQAKADEIKAASQQQSLVSSYKSNAIKGKVPTEAQKAAFDALDDAKKAKVLAEIDKAKAAQAKAALPPEQAKPGQLDASKLVQIGPQKGSNPGGTFQDVETGAQWYIKRPASMDNARNEVLAGKLYEAAGVEVPEMVFTTFEGQPAIASKIIEGLAKGNADQLANAAGSLDSYVVDAWLANWDVVGLGYDNLLLKAGRAVRVDTGGALRYRAQGGLKGGAFGDQVGELQSMRDTATNYQAASVFGRATREQLVAGARRVLAIDDDKIRAIVEAFGPEDALERAALVRRLIARREDIRRQFPEADGARPAPVELPGSVTDTELQNIRDSRGNGYTIATDKDEIEDHNVLVYHKTSAAGEAMTSAYLKLRPDAAKRLQQKLGGGASTVNYESINDAMVAAIKSIRVRVDTGKVLDSTALGKARDAIKKHDELMATLSKEAKDGLRDAADVERIRRQLAPYIENIKRNIEAGDGAVPTWTPGEPFMGITIGQPKLPKGSLNAQRRTGGYNIARLERGHIRETEQTYNQINVTRYEITTDDGVVLRFYPDDDQTYFALRGRVEVDAKGVTSASADAVFRALDELGIDSSRTTPLTREELYLQKIAYANKIDDGMAWRQILAIESQEARVKAMKEAIALDIGYDLDASPYYHPDGELQAFGHGRRVQYRPELLGNQDWPAFERDYKLHHTITNGELADCLERIINGGGQMATTTDKMRRGIPLGGLSPVHDLASGGASYFFTRIKTTSEAMRRPGLVWKSRVAARADAITYDGDRYGRTTGTHVRDNRISDIDGMRRAAMVDSNETILKDSLSIFDSLEAIVASNETERRAIVAMFRRNGYSAWPDGRKLDEVIVSRR